jgi:two-component system OmpR family sensor kinase
VTGTLTSRLVLAMTLVAVLATGAAALLTAPLVQGAVESAARAPLGRQADLLARLPNSGLLVQRVERRLGVQDLALGVVTPAGVRRGAATALSDDQVTALLAGDDVSGRGSLDGVPVVIEARPAARGGAVVLTASAASVESTATALRRRMLLALALGLLVALGAALLVGSRLTRPLGRTAEAARRLASGERGVDLPVAGTREVEDVVEALGTLDRALSASESRQRQFLLSVSHELRTPLTAIRGLAEGLADGTIDPAEARGVGRTLSAESQRLEHYVTDLLALARLEADDFALRREPVDLAALVHEAGSAWADRARSKGLRIRVDAAEGALWLDSDGARLRQVLDTLADNAVRVCPAGAEVVFAAARHTDTVGLEVRDSGPGLTADDLAHAFEPGELHDRYAGTRPGGQGLGLALAQRLVTRLGGTITATAAPEGGVRFSILLPH